MVSPEMIMKMFEKTCDVTGEVMHSFDELKFAEAVAEMCNAANSDEIYTMMEDAVMKDTTLSIDEKLDRWTEIAALKEKAQSTRQEEQVERMDKHETNRGRIACDVVAGVFSGGIFTVAKLLSNSVKASKEKKEEENILTFKKEA